MRSRRGEVPFVAIRVGRSQDPREVLGLARELKVSRATALGFVALWEEMILEVGDAITGRLKGYSANHIAAKLDFSGPPRRLLDALKTAGLLASHRGVFVHPYWRQSVTGQYASDRAELRESWRLKKQAQRDAGQPGDVPAMSPGRLGDNGGTSQGTADIDRLTNGNGAQTPPLAPPRAGGDPGASRWEWLLAHHKRPMDAPRCTSYLSSLSDEDWALVQWVTELPPGGGPLKLSRKKRVLAMDTHALLAKQAFLQLRPEWVEKLRRDRAPERRSTPRPPAPPAEDEAAVRATRAVAFVLAQLADPDLTDADKEQAKARFRTAHPEAPPPWGN